MAERRALVLGGGGIAGIAWHTGLLAAWSEAGIDVTSADFVLGTSAGATVAAQIGSGIPVRDWFDRQVDPALQSQESAPRGMSVTELWETMVRLTDGIADPEERRRRIGAMAVAAETVPEPVRRAVVAARIPSLDWSERPIAVVAVDAASGERRVFDAGSGVDLVDAVAASSAVPGVWPPVTIGAARYIDGGISSLCNADLVVGYGRALVLAPMADPALADQLDDVGAKGRALVVTPDEESVRAFGPAPLDPAVRAPAARAGFAQGGRTAPEVRAFWDS